MKRIGFSLLLSVSLLSCTSDGNKSNSQVSDDPCTGFDQVDKEMLDLIALIRKNNDNNRLFIDRFNMAQVYWIQYRDRHLRALYPEDWDRVYRKEYGKDIFNPCKCKELVRMTKLRINELQMWLDGGPEDQKECPSSWN